MTESQTQDTEDKKPSVYERLSEILRTSPEATKVEVHTPFTEESAKSLVEDLRKSTTHLSVIVPLTTNKTDIGNMAKAILESKNPNILRSNLGAIPHYTDSELRPPLKKLGELCQENNVRANLLWHTIRFSAPSITEKEFEEISRRLPAILDIAKTVNFMTEERITSVFNGANHTDRFKNDRDTKRIYIG